MKRIVRYFKDGYPKEPLDWLHNIWGYDIVDFMLWAAGFFCLIWFVICLFCPCGANAADLPEYADLTFVDQADLDSQVDSVLGVPDTTWALKNDVWFRNDSRGIAQYIPYDSIHTDLKIPIITCRRWAGLTVYEMPHAVSRYGYYGEAEGAGRDRRCQLYDHPDSLETIVPGKARLWWWEEEE